MAQFLCVCSDIYIIFLGCLGKGVRSVLLSTSDNVRGEYAEESSLGVKKIVNEIQIYNHQVLFSQVHKSSPPPLNSILSGGSMKANQSDACVGNSPMDWHL